TAWSIVPYDPAEPGGRGRIAKPDDGIRGAGCSGFFRNQVAMPRGTPAAPPFRFPGSSAQLSAPLLPAVWVAGRLTGAATAAYFSGSGVVPPSPLTPTPLPQGERGGGEGGCGRSSSPREGLTWIVGR